MPGVGLRPLTFHSGNASVGCASSVDCVLPERPVGDAVAGGVHPGHQADAGGRADRARVGLRELHAFFRQALDVRRSIAVVEGRPAHVERLGEILPAEVVHEEEQDVRLLRGRDRGAPRPRRGKACQPHPGHADELPAVEYVALSHRLLRGRVGLSNAWVFYHISVIPAGGSPAITISSSPGGRVDNPTRPLVRARREPWRAGRGGSSGRRSSSRRQTAPRRARGTN